MIDKSKLRNDIQKILQAFSREEAGNKITQFNMIGLTNLLLGLVDGNVTVSDVQKGNKLEEKKPVKKDNSEVDQTK